MQTNSRDARSYSKNPRLDFTNLDDVERRCLRLLQPICQGLLGGAVRRSGGSPLSGGDGGRHQSSAPITAKLLNALIQNGAAMPSPPMTPPPRAGPIAPLMLTPTPLLVTAALRSCFGTNCVTTDCHAGVVNAAPAPSRNVNTRRMVGLISPSRPESRSLPRRRSGRSPNRSESGAYLRCRPAPLRAARTGTWEGCSRPEPWRQ